MKTIGRKIQEIRKGKGLSQEELAEQANISLRTVQRIENGTNIPRGFTLSSICSVLEVNIESLLDFGKVEDKTFFIFFHLSIMLGFMIPLGDIILPLVLWLSNKNKIIGLDNQGKNLLLFRTCFLIFGLLFLIIPSVFHTTSGSPKEFLPFMANLIKVYFSFNVIVSIIYPIYVAISIYKNDKLKNYYPHIFK